MSSKIKWGITEDAVEEAIRGVLDRAYAHDETIADDKYLLRTGGTLTGNLTLDPTTTTAPLLSLVNVEGSGGEGPSRTTLRKNATSVADYGTVLTDFAWGNGSTMQKQAQLRLWATNNPIYRLQLNYITEDGALTTDTIFGTHNPPTVQEVSGLQTELSKFYSAQNKPTISDVTGLQDALDAISTTGGYDGILPVSHGGTGAENPLNAITALGGLSAASVGTPIVAGDNIDEYKTPGTYVSSDGTVSASLQGTPPWTSAGFKLYVFKSYTNSTLFQLATGTSPNGIAMRSKPNASSNWAGWVTISTSSHNHIIRDIEGLQDELDNKAVVNHTHNYLSKTGGTLTGNLTLDPEASYIPRLTFITDEKEGVGPAMGVVYKNASADSDNGTQMVDYVWGNGLVNENKNVRIALRAGVSDPNALRIIFNDGDGTGTLRTCQIYGEHNRPWIDGQISLGDTADLNTITAMGWYRCPLASTSQSIKHTPQYNTTTLVNTSFGIFNMTVGAIGPVSAPYIYQEILRMNDGKRWYRYTTNATAADPTWTEWVET